MLLRARFVLPVSSEPIDDGAVVVQSGRIADIGPHVDVASRNPGETVRDLGDAILLPGFVNVHSHLELTLLRGLLDGLPFFPWIRRLVEIKSQALEPDKYVFYSLLGAAEMIRAGITTVADCSDTGAPLEALRISGLRGIVFVEAFAPATSWLPQALPRLESRLDAFKALVDDRVGVGISPHSTFMACDELLDACARLAEDRHLPLSIHVAESPEEDAFVRTGSGAIAEHHAARGFPVVARGHSPVEHLAERGWLDLPGRVQLVHLAHASAADLELVAKAHGAVGLAACPRSNASLGNGLPDFAGWTRRGLSWGLGTDGAPSVGACDIFSEMRFASLAWKATTHDARQGDARTIVARATLEAARSLGMESEIGSLVVGKRADLCAIRLEAPRVLPAHEPHGVLVHCATPDDVVLTMVDGKILFDGREVATIDEEQVAARCREGSAVVRATLAQDGTGAPRPPRERRRR